ncbi:MAG: hypothetical protein IT189_06505 [Microbacteriaceae bacterium]|nr:hypothetical protein [Microbacteriaceae bacterium]
MIDPSPGSVLAASDQGKPDTALHGFAFDGPHLILGEAGRLWYGNAHARAVHPGNDGSYIAVNQRGRVAVVGTDHAGYRRLFLYRSDGNWAISDSFTCLADYVSERRWTMTPDPRMLQSLAMQGTIGNQLVSHSTAVREIEMLPSSRVAHIRDSAGGSELEIREADSDRGLRGRSYRSLMRAYVAEWLPRIATVLASPLPIVSDLTGGRDSRTVLAAILRAGELTGIDVNERVRFASDPQLVRDLAVAEEIARRYGLRLNTTVTNAGGLLPGAEIVRQWRTVNAGVYYPIHLDDAQAAEVSLGGSGGESNRNFYPGPGLSRLFDVRAKYFFDRDSFEHVKTRALADAASLAVRSERRLDHMIIHYRHFRDRLHGGRRGHRSLYLTPLASRHLRFATTAQTPELRGRGQILADLLINLSPQLAQMEYESSAKQLDSRHFDDAIDLSSRGRVIPGRVFGTLTEPAPTSGPRSPSSMEVLAEEFFRALPVAQQHGLVPDDFATTTAELMRASLGAGRFDHPEDAQPVALIMLAGDLVRYGASR